MYRLIKNIKRIYLIQLVLGIFVVTINTSCCITGYCHTTESTQQGVYEDHINEYNTN